MRDLPNAAQVDRVTAQVTPGHAVLARPDPWFNEAPGSGELR